MELQGLCNSVFTLPDTETSTETDKNGLYGVVKVFVLHRDRYQHRFLLDNVPILSVYVSVSVLVSGSVNAP